MANPIRKRISFGCGHTISSSTFIGENQIKKLVATITVKLLSSDENEEKQIFGPDVFDSKHQECGIDSFILWTDLVKPENGYVINDECKFKIKIKTSPMQDVSTDKWMKLQTLRQCCDGSSYGSYRLIINKLNESFGICSPEIQLSGMTFRVIAVKKNNFKFHYYTKAPLITLHGQIKQKFHVN